MTQPNSKRCPQCGKQFSSEIPGADCPQCLMALGMSGGLPTTASPNHGSDGAHVPPVEKLVAAFPNLQIQHLTGQGGMGAVYQALQVNLDRTIALKILSPILSRDPTFAERFLREARTLAKLAHPNIVTVFDFGKADDFYFLTMEFIDGVNLRDTILANLLNPSEALAIIPQICDALQYAHDKGVVHRDIKPENILIAKNGNVKIADFGLAKILDPMPTQVSLTGTRQVLGTRNYMAPEQIETPESVDHRADLYSLGVVFYELLTGELPLGRFSLPSEKAASVSARLDDVVMRTLEKDPAKRYQQASEIKTACESAQYVDPTPDANQVRHENASMESHDDKTNSSGSPICQPFPVTIEDIYASIASGYGMMRGFETHLELEYEIRDSVVDHKWSSSKFRLPVERIAWIKMHQGLISTYIEIQADQFDAVSELPNSKHGSFRVYLKKKNRPPAEQLVHNVQQLLRGKNNPITPVPPIKTPSHDDKSNNIAAALLIFLCLAASCFVILVIVLGSLWFSKSSHSDPAKPMPVSQMEQMEPMPQMQVMKPMQPMQPTPESKNAEDRKTPHESTVPNTNEAKAESIPDEK